MANTDAGQPDLPDYDDTIPTPLAAASDDTQDPNPGDPASGWDDPPAGDQPPADGALNADGVPLRADGTGARDKGEVD